MYKLPSLLMVPLISYTFTLYLSSDDDSSRLYPLSLKWFWFVTPLPNLFIVTLICHTFTQSLWSDADLPHFYQISLTWRRFATLLPNLSILVTLIWNTFTWSLCNDVDSSHSCVSPAFLVDRKSSVHNTDVSKLVVSGSTSLFHD